MSNYSAYVYISTNREGSIQQVIAQGKTAKGMLSVLRRYVAKMGKHSPCNHNSIVYLWCIDRGVYDRATLRDYAQ